jgi:predicted RNA-binding Zn-ribbon protein involved in translation (DUF1610 family)
MEITSTITSVIDSFKATKDVVGSLLTLKIDAEVRTEIFKVQNQLGAALDQLFDLRERGFALQTENHELKSRAAAEAAWTAARSEFELVTTAGKATVYQFKGTPAHYACPNCMDGKKEIQRLQPLNRLNGLSKCNGCDKHYPIEPAKAPPQGRVARSDYLDRNK